MRRGAAIAVAFALLLVVVGPTASSADEWDVSGSTDGESATVELTGSSLGDLIRSPAVPDWVFDCSWSIWTTAEVSSYYGQAQGPGVTPVIEGEPDQEWSVVFCGSGVDTGGALPTGVLSAWRIGDRPPQVVLDWLVDYAYASVEIPAQVGWSAPFGDEVAPVITQLPTWLWIEPAVWGPRSATTPPVFGITATVTITPVNVSFEGADGEVVDCGPNLGPVYDFNQSEEAQHSDCTLTYHHSSAVGDWSLVSTITWEVTYTCSAFCGPGTREPFTVVNTRDVRVAELQAVLTTPDT